MPSQEAGFLTLLRQRLQRWLAQSAPVSGTAVRLLEVDALRGVAALSVAVFHYTSYYDQRYGHGEAMPLRFAVGTHGVKLFFVISGFVILATLLRCTSGGDFARARFLRLYPAFWVSLVFSHLAVSLELPDRVVTTRDLLWNLSMVPGLLGSRPVDGVYWTLSVELLFYAGMFVLASLGMLTTTRVNRAFLGWVGLSLVWGSTPEAVQALPAVRLAATVLILDHISLFALGITLFQLHQTREVRASNLLLAALSAVSLWVCQGRGHVAFGVLSVGLVFIALFRPPKLLRSRALLFFGAISYAIYLLHQNIGFAVLHAGYRLGVPPLLSLTLAFGLVVALATGIHHWVEKPAIALNRRLRSTSRQQAAAVES